MHRKPVKNSERGVPGNLTEGASMVESFLNWTTERRPGGVLVVSFRGGGGVGPKASRFPSACRRSFTGRWRGRVLPG